MNRTKLLSIACASAWVAFSCTQTGPTASSGTPVASGGSDSSSQNNNGGATAAGGSQATSAEQNQGGSETSSTTENSEGGSDAAGGDKGNGGSGDSGGDSGNGGSTSEDTAAADKGGTTSTKTTAKGGATSSGTTAVAAGGTSAKTTTSAAPKGGSTSANGGTSSATGGASAATTTDDLNIVPDLDGFYWEGSCMGNISASGKNCPFAKSASDSSCPSGSGTWDTRGAIRDKVINVKGTTGTKYTINFEVRGVVGTRCYTGGTQASTSAPSATGANNTWYVGGKQYKDSIWNTYEIRVEPPVSGESNVYYANAFSPTAGSNEEWCQKEATYEVKYTAKFAVTGGGTIKFTVHDANCLAQQNCGSNDKDNTCTAPRTVDLSGMSPAASITQPPTNSVGGKTYYPQWLYFDVKSVTSP